MSWRGWLPFSEKEIAAILDFEVIICFLVDGDKLF